jgi:carboxymethylenebutenolidase
VIEIQAADGVAEAYLATPEGEGPFPAVLLYMDAYGLRPQIERMADRLAAEGYAVLAPNVFYRDHEAELGTSDFGVLREYMKALTPDAVERDARAYLDFLSPGRPVGVTGYCMGGRLALVTAGRLPARVAAAASFHAGNLVTDAPESPHRVFGDIRAEVYVAHADEDRSMPPEQQQRVEAELAGATHRAELYEGARHGFTMADLEVYDEQADERHWRELLGLLGRTIGASP